jgi:hypothetical protein
MLAFIKKLFGSKSADKVAPYKVEAPVIQDAPTEGNFTKEQVQKAVKAAKKPVVKKATTRKPKAPKA